MRILIIVLSVAGILVSANSARADRRVALVVGNGAYAKVQQLPNPPISAAAMADLLRKTGFDVVEGIDLARAEMTKRLLEFGAKAKGADLAIFYYSGHGIAISGTEYLLPVDADIKSERDAKLGGAINLDAALDQAMSGAKVELVFLDASRDYPFPAAPPSASKTSHSGSPKAGPTQTKSRDNTLTVFATGPGQAAPDGPAGTIRPLTRALIANIAVPDVEIQQAMSKVRAQVNEETQKQQLPWGHSNLLGDVYLNKTAAPASSAAPGK